MSKLNDNKEVLLHLYEIVSKEEKYYIGRFFNHLKLHWAVISALISAYILAIYKFKHIELLTLSFIIPTGIIILTFAFKEISKRDYRRFLDSIIFKAKIESLLGLDKLKLNNKAEYWKNEPLIPIRHLENRKNFENSKKFFEFYIEKKGALAVYNRIFIFVYVIAILMYIHLLIKIFLLIPFK